MTFKDILRRWNGGKIIGAQKRLAERLGVKQATVSRWVSGHQGPNEDIRERVAKILEISIEQLMSCFSQRQSSEVREPAPHYGADVASALRDLSGKVEKLSKEISALRREVGEQKSNSPLKG